MPAMNDRSASSHASPAASPFGDVKRLTMPKSPPRTKSGSGLPTSPTRGDKRASPAKAVSPFYSTRMKDTSETSAATALFRKGAEQIVLDHDKQAKLANLIKAVTVQKQALTEEREQAIAGFKAERAKLRTMQQKTLSLYAKMKTDAIEPVSVDIRDIDSSDDEGAGAVASYDMARKAGSIFASLRRGSDERLVFDRWRSWAKQHAVAEAHVRRMTRRWELARLARMSRAWWRLAVNDSRGIVAAAEMAATRSRKRVGRRAFAAWRGVAAGLDEEELAKLSSASARFVAGSPAAGLIAIAQLARSRGGTDAETRRRIVADAVAAADRSAGAFDVEDILGGAEGSDRFLSPIEGEDDAGGDANAVAVRAAAILFCKTARGTTRNVMMAWAAAAARARAAPERRGERVAFRTSRGGSRGDGRGGGEGAGGSRKESLQVQVVLVGVQESVQEVQGQGVARGFADDVGALGEQPVENVRASGFVRLRRPTLRDDAGDGVPGALAAGFDRVVRGVLHADREVALDGRRGAGGAGGMGAEAGTENLRRVFVRRRVPSGAGFAEERVDVFRRVRRRRRAPTGADAETSRREGEISRRGRRGRRGGDAGCRENVERRSSRGRARGGGAGGAGEEATRVLRDHVK